MKIRKVLVLLTAILVVSFSMSAVSGWWPFSEYAKDLEAPTGDIVEVDWDDLIPDDFVQPENPFIAMSQEEIDKLMDGSEESEATLAKLQAEFNYAPVVEDLDGKRVKIPAYITPLEYNDDSMIKEFLLVPYVGACIHVPPPPANQVVHAQSPIAIKFDGMYDPVWAIGTIRAETVVSDLAESGYKLEVEAVQPYTE